MTFGNFIIETVCEKATADLFDLLKDRRISIPHNTMAVAALRQNNFTYAEIKVLLGYNWDYSITSVLKSHQRRMKNNVHYKKVFDEIKNTIEDTIKVKGLANFDAPQKSQQHV